METPISGLPDAEKWINSIREELQELRYKLEQNDTEIDALQIESQKAQHPWYRDMSVLVSIAAVLFSLFTTALSLYNSRQQEIHNNKTELRGLIQRINELNREYADLLIQPDARNQIYHSSAISAEIVLLADQAYELIENIPGRVSPREYSAVAEAFSLNSYPELAEDMYKKAIDAAETRMQKVDSLRNYASFLILNQRPQEVREMYAAAITANNEFDTAYPVAILRTDLWTHLSWAGYEFTQHECASGVEQLNKASEIARQLSLPANDPHMLQLNLLVKSAETCEDS